MDIRRFVIKTLLFASPLYLLIAVYGVLDVFKVLRYHDPYYVNGRPMGVVLNAGHVATMIFDHNRDEPMRYQIGNSTLALMPVASTLTEMPSRCMVCGAR